MSLVFAAQPSDRTIDAYIQRALAHVKGQGTPVTISWNDEFQIEITPTTTEEEILEAFWETLKASATQVAMEAIGNILANIGKLSATKTNSLAEGLQRLNHTYCRKK